VSLQGTSLRLRIDTLPIDAVLHGRLIIFLFVARPGVSGRTEDLADGHEAARIEIQADVAQLVEQLIRNQ
jgi:hypothetical protein